MIFEWKQGRFGKADPQKVGDELMAIGYRDAASVVKAAKNSKRELHKCFEWDNTKAGEQYRLAQARLVLRMIVTVEESPEGSEPEKQVYRAFESVRFSDVHGKPDKAMTYIPTQEALSDPELRVQVMGRLESTIGEAEATAKAYEYLVPSFGKVRERLQEAKKAMKV